MSETQPVISFHPQTIEEENVDASSSSAGAAASRDRWDPELAAELLYFQQSAPSPADYSSTCVILWAKSRVSKTARIHKGSHMMRSSLPCLLTFLPCLVLSCSVPLHPSQTRLARGCYIGCMVLLPRPSKFQVVWRSCS